MTSYKVDSNRVVCPLCDAILKTAKPIPAGTKLSCKICGARFSLQHDGQLLNPPEMVPPLASANSDFLARAERLDDKLTEAQRKRERRMQAKDKVVLAPAPSPAVLEKYREEIAAVRKRLRKSPREYCREELAAIRIYPPIWLAEEDELIGQYDQQRVITENGSIVWAAVIQADPNLVTEGDNDHAVRVLYSQDSKKTDSLIVLQELAVKLARGKFSSEAWQEVVRKITDEPHPLGVTIPESLTGGLECMVTTLVVPRKGLPGEKLSISAFPVFTLHGSPYVIMVPCQFWD